MGPRRGMPAGGRGLFLALGRSGVGGGVLPFVVGDALTLLQDFVVLLTHKRAYNRAERDGVKRARGAGKIFKLHWPG